MNIVCYYDPPPIPDRRFDWTAIDADSYDGPGSPIGCGQTEADARADLAHEIALREDRPEVQPTKRTAGGTQR